MKKVLIFFVVILRLLILEFISTAKPRTRIVVTNLTVNFNKDYVTGVAHIDNQNKFNGLANLTVPLDRLLVEYSFDVKVFGRPSDLKGYRNFMNKSLECCTFLKNPLQTDPISYLFYNIAVLDKRNKLANKCPIEPGDYYVKDFLISAVQLPVTPNLMFNLTIYAYTFAPHKIMIMDFCASGLMQNGNGRTRKRIA